MILPVWRLQPTVHATNLGVCRHRFADVIVHSRCKRTTPIFGKRTCRHRNDGRVAAQLRFPQTELTGGLKSDLFQIGESELNRTLAFSSGHGNSSEKPIRVMGAPLGRWHIRRMSLQLRDAVLCRRVGIIECRKPRVRVQVGEIVACQFH